VTGNHIHAVLLAGGKGTRFWPLSREDHPKQMLQLFSDRMLIEETCDRIQPLIPALKSNWLIAHVVTCFLGYAAFAVSCGISILYLVRRTASDNPHPKGIAIMLPTLRHLDEFNYQMIVFGFLWLSLGIITGSVWANSAWGTYWSWDPKETWSLITWLVYAALLHARSMQGWRGKRVAWLSVAGFGCVLFTYFGVNFLLSGLHSYATK